MDPSPPFPLLTLTITITAIFFSFSPSLCDNIHDPDQYSPFTDCIRTFNCGALENIPYPFWGGSRPQSCGRQGFQLQCPSSTIAGPQFPIIKMDDLEFYVLQINQSQYTMRLARTDFMGDVCKSKIHVNTTIDSHNFHYLYPLDKHVHLFYNCTWFTSSWKKYAFNCSKNQGKEGYLLANPSLREEGYTKNVHPLCEINIEVVVLQEHLDELLVGRVAMQKVMDEGFIVGYENYQEECDKCERTNGACGFDLKVNDFVCHCSDRTHARVCTKGKHYWKNRAIIGISAGVGGIAVAYLILSFFRKIKKTSSVEQVLEAFIRNYGPLPIKRYRYTDIKNMTDSFKEKLGQGGYGCVYKGKLPDSGLVAVKVLNPSKRKGEEFFNEVASICRTSHVNIVSLLGYCLEGEKRALVYELVTNGSLEKFIYGGNSSKATQELGWEKLHEIAIGIARGLEYLHRGCRTKILHFDIKPHNILLDENLRPKISDFGLAKLCTKMEGVVSMQEARGTIGYIAPEVSCRNFGEVTHKSDVYSYGMMILEMVGRRKNVDVGVSQTSKIYFPDWIYNQLNVGEDLRLPGIMIREENELARKMIVTGLWCIQTMPPDRPSMDRVIEILEGSTEALQIPPKPFLSSPSRPHVNISATSTS